jgi:hypothetical protein
MPTNTMARHRSIQTATIPLLAMTNARTVAVQTALFMALIWRGLLRAWEAMAMPDISMCNAQCPVSIRCRRHPNSGTKPNYRQSWALFEPKDKDGCEAFYPKREVIDTILEDEK